ncbi:hypothetical protein DVA86_20570 [Streptomyces armeniacus]|uniref:Uncharacterized protein n=1 Tax=Streptomyces armeniacus TaxID=83291 RepID=A0A345XSS3_9ACTN|nr:hypothetical protein [Streptomyces armeniacus]AXK34689.1 hypothetical protein DVA86_20570 [Streptomyces armeniacus]
MPRTITLFHDLDNSGLRHGASTAASTSRYNHPHFQHFQRRELGKQRGETIWHFRAFTGREPEPRVPRAIYNDETLTWTHRTELYSQYEAARILWSHALLRAVAGPVLQEAVGLWTAWKVARDNLRAAFKAFWDTPDDRWRAQMLRLVSAERAARNAAEAWDAVACRLTRLAADQVDVAGYDHELPLRTVAQELRVDMSDWYITYEHRTPDSYSMCAETPLVEDLLKETESQREQLREVAHLAGDRALD